MNSSDGDNLKLSELSYTLITGGIGFIGSHVVVQTLEKGRPVVILDNMSNSKIDVLYKIKQLSNITNPDDQRLIFVQGDIRDETLLDNLFSKYDINTVMHFAALKSVSESQKYPDLYYDVNVIGTKTILKIMKRHNCKNFIYSSSATVYGVEPSPVVETTPTGNTLLCNYARNKFDMEQYLIEHTKINNNSQDCQNNQENLSDWNVVILRYFNPIGAHPSGLLGEDPNDIPNNIFPYLLRVARWCNTVDESGKKSHQESPYRYFTVFGDDYDTPDGTCIRDYVHVQDLARAHIDVHSAILDRQNSSTGLLIYNVGTGHGTSVFELINTLNSVLVKSGKNPIEYIVGARRPGDIVVSYAKVDKISHEIGFKTVNDVKQMCIDGLRFIGV
ncbi:UDP-glucose 4-epimerase GalE [Yasminevirus sp. GU-2018]|uniref:UDP-glucose 4-epimerase n=1 Tax=Yasminevirus sp. GU-2018 TaxID=2420051 RepID=A0A5K0U973_9VIRU|nr:UDP-glucose 4-epimerase GalE [Yasminevirus sp. GU-2018]